MTEFVFTGSMTRRSPFFPDACGAGLTVWRWNGDGTRLEVVETVSDLPNPSWLAVDPKRGRLYAASELHDSTDGCIVSFRVDPETGRLGKQGVLRSEGSATCHLALSENGYDLAWANYATLPLGTEPDASFVLHRSADFGHVHHPRVHPGTTPESTGRQDRRHAHCALFDARHDRLLTTDLGLDTLFATPLAADHGGGPDPLFVFPPGSGPRHVTAFPDFSVFYVVHELTPRVDVLVAEDEKLAIVQSVAIGARDVAQPAGIMLSPDGRRLFATVRGTNEIRGFAIKQDGRLALPQTVVMTGDTPRDLAFSGNGQRLLVACQDSGEIRAYEMDPETGALVNELVVAETGSPTSVKVLNIGKDQIPWPI